MYFSMSDRQTVSNRIKHLFCKHSRRAVCCRFSLALALGFAVPAQALPSAEEDLAVLGIPSGQLARLERGEIVSQPAQESGEKELAMDVALFVPQRPAKVFAYLQQAEVEAIDSDVLAHGEIPPGAGVEAFGRLGFSASDGEEVEGLLNAEPGDRFNLSAGEIDGFMQLQEKLSKVTDEAARAEAVSRHYREILRQRWHDYRAKGLAGIAPYAHAEGIPAAEPAAELRASAASDRSLARFYPELNKAWLDYPAGGLPTGATEQYFWMNRTVEGRPTVVLGHRLVQSTGGGGVIAIRHFYVSHSYNSINLVIGCLPHRDGSIVFYAQRTSTDQVAGMARELRHAIGRERMKEQMTGRLESLRKALKAGG